MSYKLIIDNDRELIRYFHAGTITKETVGEAWTELLKLPEFTQLKYNLLTDYRESSTEIVIEEIDEIVTFLTTLEETLKHKKQAILADEPTGTALSMIFEDRVNKSTNFKVRIFSTEEAALDWLALS